MLESARELFSEQGYAGTSTRQIAEAADVAEPLLFRHFGTKARLFDAAMLSPFRDFISEFMERWHDELANPEEIGDLTQRFIDGLYDLMRENRRLFLALIAARAFEEDTNNNGDRADSELSIQLDVFDDYLSKLPSRPTGLDSAVSFRLTVGVIMAATVLDDWLFPVKENRPAEERIRRELSQFILFGVLAPRRE